MANSGHSLQWEKREIQEAARQAGIKPQWLWGIYGAETSFGQNLSTSVAGAQGPFQFMPETAAGMGVDPHDFRSAARGAARYIADGLRQFGGDIRLALAAYNAGSGAVRQYGGIPPYGETQAYVPKVLEHAQQWSAPGGGGKRGRRSGGGGGRTETRTVDGAPRLVLGDAGSASGGGALAALLAQQPVAPAAIQTAAVPAPRFAEPAAFNPDALQGPLAAAVAAARRRRVVV